MRKYTCKYTDSEKVGAESSCWEQAGLQFIDQYPWKDPRYLSFEINPLGALLIGLGSTGNNISYLTDSRGQFQIQTACEKGYWQAFYSIPFAFILKYFKNISDTIKGNFMKCADRSVTPHHGCWNLICTDIPMFHVPQYFGSYCSHVTIPRGVFVRICTKIPRVAARNGGFCRFCASRSVLLVTE